VAQDKRIVVKFGTNTLSSDGREPDPDYLERMADEIVELREAGHEVLIVSSGAIGSGIWLLDRDQRVREVETRQALAAVGQAHLIQAWEQAFAQHDVHVGQLLLTYDALKDRERFLNVRNATERLLDLGVVPIANENDTVSTEEITQPETGQQATFGDNDKLSAYVATKAKADLLVILSDVDGLYTDDPDRPDAELVPVVEEVTEQTYEMAGGAGSVASTGGMTTKLDAAKIATESGIPMVIADGSEERILSRILDGEPVGTRFVAGGRGTEKKRWLRIARPQGTIRVDEGAKRALEDGRHLLPAGVLGVEGSFPRGSVVEIAVDGEPVAKAVSSMSAKQLETVKGLHSVDVQERLDVKSPNVTRKNNLAMLGECKRGG
jgi:glutamate 5-kinase